VPLRQSGHCTKIGQYSRLSFSAGFLTCAGGISVPGRMFRLMPTSPPSGDVVPIRGQSR